MRHDPSLTRSDPDFLLRYAAILRAEASRRDRQPDFQEYLLERADASADAARAFTG